MYMASNERYEKMIYNRCGKSGLKLSAVSLGLWHNFGDTGNFENMKKMCFTAFDNGIPEDSRIKTDGRFLHADALTPERLEQIRALNEIAKKRGQTLAEMALSWILKDGIVTSVLVGASKPEQILDNIKAIENTNFTEEELRKINLCIKPGVIAGFFILK